MAGENEVPIHILHVTQAAGGVATHVAQLLKYQAADFKNSIAVSSDIEELVSSARSLGVDVFRVEVARDVRFLADLRALLQLTSIVRRLRPSIIHAHSSKAGALGRVAGWLTRTPCVYTPNAFAFLGAVGIRRVLYLGVEKLLVPLTARLIAVGRSEYRRAIDDVGYAIDRVTVVSNAVDVPDEPAGLTWMKRSRPLVLMVGRLSAQKNPEMFVRAAQVIRRSVPTAEFLIVGSGYHEWEAEIIRRLIIDLELEKNLCVAPWMSRSQVADTMRQAAVVVVPSRYDGMPFAALEAMSLGRPLVGTRVDGVKDVVIHGETGFLVEVGEFEEMADRIRQLICDPELNARLGVAGKAWVMRHADIRQNVRAIADVYREVLDQRTLGTSGNPDAAVDGASGA